MSGYFDRKTRGTVHDEDREKRRRDEKKSGRWLLGTGQAGKAADALKAREKKRREMLDM